MNFYHFINKLLFIQKYPKKSLNKRKFAQSGHPGHQTKKSVFEAFKFLYKPFRFYLSISLRDALILIAKKSTQNKDFIVLTWPELWQGASFRACGIRPETRVIKFGKLQNHLISG
jgi:hypothetical protein